jgi:ABC-type uncharacterized transport system permease subunit
MTQFWTLFIIPAILLLGIPILYLIGEANKKIHDIKSKKMANRNSKK